MITEIGEPVSVGVVFRHGKVHPRWFVWRGKRIAVSEVTFRWEDEQGESRHYHFSASDGVNLYELRLDAQTMNWHLDRVYCEG